MTQAAVNIAVKLEVALESCWQSKS